MWFKRDFLWHTLGSSVWELLSESLFWCLNPAHLGYYTQICTLNSPCKKQAVHFSPWHNQGTSVQWQNGSMGTQQHSDSWASLSKVWPQPLYAPQLPNHIFNPLQIGYKSGHWQFCCFRDTPIEVTGIKVKLLVKNLHNSQIHGYPIPRFDLSTYSIHSPKTRKIHLTPSKSGIKQDIDSLP